MRVIFLVLVLAAGEMLGAEVVKNEAAVMGPLVDVTLQNGESKKGQWLGFNKGVMTLMLDSGEVLTRESKQVLSVKFITPEVDNPKASQTVTPTTQPAVASVLTAQNTKLTELEVFKLQDLRRRFHNKKDPGSKDDLTPDEVAEMNRILAKNEKHIEVALKELTKANNVDEAETLVFDLTKSLAIHRSKLGDRFHDNVAVIKNSVEKIENESVRKKVMELIPSWENRLKPLLPFKKQP